MGAAPSGAVWAEQTTAPAKSERHNAAKLARITMLLKKNTPYGLCGRFPCEISKRPDGRQQIGRCCFTLLIRHATSRRVFNKLPRKRRNERIRERHRACLRSCGGGLGERDGQANQAGLTGNADRGAPARLAGQ